MSKQSEYNKRVFTGISITRELQKTLDEYKLIPTESYNQLIIRLIKEVEVLQNELDKHN